MLTINKIFPQEKIPEKTESFLFFDIETSKYFIKKRLAACHI